MEEEKVVVEEVKVEEPKAEEVVQPKAKKGIFAKVVFIIFAIQVVFGFLGGLLPTTFFAIVTVYTAGLSILWIILYLILGIISLITAKGNRTGKTLGLLTLILCWLPFIACIIGLYLYKIIGNH